MTTAVWIPKPLYIAWPWLTGVMAVLYYLFVPGVLGPITALLLMAYTAFICCCRQRSLCRTLGSIGAVLLVLLTNGCASNMQVPTAMIGDVADSAEAGLITVADASVAKEAVANKTVQTFIEEYGKAHKVSGTTITFGQVTKTVMIDGHELVYTETGITQIETREMPTFNNVRVSQQPSVHPGWAMAQSSINTAIKWGVGGFVADGMFSAFESAWDRETYQFTGNPNLSNSFNTAGNDQTFTAAELGQFAGDGGFCGGGDCGAAGETDDSEWYNGIIGCSSEESYLNGLCAVQPE